MVTQRGERERCVGDAWEDLGSSASGALTGSPALQQAKIETHVCNAGIWGK
jgi:hypothetical protein